MAGSDKNIGQLIQISTLKSNDLIYIGRTSNGTDCYITVYDFIAGVLTHPQVSKTCARNDDTIINLGATNTVKAVTINCYFNRYNKIRQQIITIFHNTIGTAKINPGQYEIISNIEDDNLGITLTAQITDGQLQLKISVDDRDSYDVDLDYVVLATIAV